MRSSNDGSFLWKVAKKNESEKIYKLSKNMNKEILRMTVTSSFPTMFNKVSPPP